MADKPLLFIDVDGVISTYDFGAEDLDPRHLHMVDGILHHIRAEKADRIKTLLPHFDNVWATGWGERANEHLVFILGMPEELEVVEFAVTPSTDGSGHWKLDALTEFSGSRPAAWIDDGHNEACAAWAAERDAPTLLVSTDPFIGVTDEQVAELIDWAAQFGAAPINAPAE